ncbi:MAG: GAF domain-containing protein [Acidobacteriota bacterium]
MLETKEFFRSLLPLEQGSLPSPAKIFSAAVNLLGSSFTVSRAVIFTMQKGRTSAKATYEYCADGITSIIGKPFPYNDSTYTKELLNAFSPLACDDIKTESRLSGFDLILEWSALSLLCAPLRLGETVIGIVSLQQCDRLREWTVAEVQRFGMVVDELSLAIEIVRPFVELRKEFERFSLVNELGRQLMLVTNVSDLFHTLVNQLRKIIGFDFVSLNLIDETTGRLHNSEQARYTEGRFSFGHFLPAGYAIPGWCVANRRVLVIRNLASEVAMQVRREWLDAGFIGCAAYPLLFNDEMMGAVMFFTRAKGGFDDGELRVLMQGMEQAAASVQRIRTIDHLIKNAGVDVQAARREELIKRISKAIGSHLDSDLVLQHAVNELGRYLSVSRCYIVLANRSAENANAVFEYRTQDVESLMNAPFPAHNNPAIAQAITINEPLMYVEAQDDESLKSIEEFLKKNGVRSTLYHLISTQGDMQALLCLDQCDRTRTWTEDERSLVVTVSQELAIALEQAELVAKLQAQAEREALLNRITAAIRGSLDLKQILQTTVESLGKTLAVDRCFIGLLDFEHEHIVIRNEFCAEGVEPMTARTLDRKLFDEISDWAKNDQGIALDDVMLDESMSPLRDISLLPNKLRSIVYVPVNSDLRLIALIGVGQVRHQRCWKREEISFMSAVADQVAVAISQARLLEQSEAQAEREALLNQIFKSMADSLDQIEIMEKVTVQLGQALAADRCTISRYDQESNRWMGIQHEYLATGIPSAKEHKELLNSPVPQWIHENRRPFVVNDITDYPLPTGKEELIETSIRSLLLVPIMRSGKVIGTLGLHQCQNIREWKEAEIDLVRSIAGQVAVAIHNAYLFQRIAESQRQWQLTFDSMTDGVAMLSPTSKVICANHALLRLVEGKNWDDVLERDYLDLFQVAPGLHDEFNPVKSALDSAVSVQLEIHDVRGRILRQNIDPILDEKDTVTGLILVIRDVTKERRAEQETAQRNRELSVLNAISEEITKSLEIDKIITSAFSKTVEVMSADTGLVMLLDETQDVLLPIAYHGQLPEVVVGMLTNLRYRRGLLRSTEDFRETFVIRNMQDESESPDTVFAEIARRLGLNSALITNLQSKNRGLGLLAVAYQHERKFEEHEIQLITAIGRQVGVAIENARLIANLQDALQKLREANRLKDEFLATLSHELRTPLTSITGWTEILAEREDNDDEMSTGLKAILNNAESLQQLINDLLDLSRIENRVLKLDLELTDLNLVVMSAAQTVKQMADNREVTIEQELGADLPQINADSNRLQQVFWNLLSNSIKFSRRGGYVRIRTLCQNGALEVRVEDNGIGIDPEFLPLVFERFRQADSSSTRRYGGLGIGLSLVKSLVEVHGGEVKAESPGKDQGSTFIVRLPVPQRNVVRTGSLEGEKKEEPTNKQVTSTLVSEQRPQVLIIEDLEDNLRMLTSILERQGYEVLTARNTEAGLRMAERYIPKLILLDINMPGRSSFEILGKLKCHQELGLTPVLAISGFSLENERQQVLAAGFAGLITKPFRRSELMAILRSLMPLPVSAPTMTIGQAISTSEFSIQNTELDLLPPHNSEP